MCSSPGCTRPKHVDSLCAHHLAGARAEIRAVALLFDSWDTAQTRPEMAWFVGVQEDPEVNLPAHLRPIAWILEALRLV